FGQPSQLLTLLGLAGAGLAVAFQDAILSVAGWFVLMGRSGIHLGDWVEINGVVGEVAELRLLKTVLLESGNWITAGHPTGRRVFFPNSFALRGSYFNYSTRGQWLWDEVQVAVPAGADAAAVLARVNAMLEAEMGPDQARARAEWAQQSSSALAHAAPAATLRPSVGGNLLLVVRYAAPAGLRALTSEQVWSQLTAALGASTPALLTQPAASA
ncbi:MAG: mechanosensitive ion channel domain-containing protein, partial [Terriglobales bacterium]